MRGFPLELSTITFSLNVMVIVTLSFSLYAPFVLDDETEVTVDAVVSMVNELTGRVLLILLALSVTFIVQFE